MNVIWSHCQEIYTEEINKIALSYDDDKRVIMVDGIHTSAYGHTKLKKWVTMPNLRQNKYDISFKPWNNWWC